jgi:hypothetical protein
MDRVRSQEGPATAGGAAWTGGPASSLPWAPLSRVSEQRESVPLSGGLLRAGQIVGVFVFIEKLRRGSDGSADGLHQEQGARAAVRANQRLRLFICFPGLFCRIVHLGRRSLLVRTHPQQRLGLGHSLLSTAIGL